MGFNIPMKTNGAFDSNSLINQFGANNDENMQFGNMQGQPQMNFDPNTGEPLNPNMAPNRNPQMNFDPNTGEPLRHMNMPQPPQIQQPQIPPQPQMNFDPNTGKPLRPMSMMQQSQRAGVHLKKGQKFAVEGAGGVPLQHIMLGLGWDVKNQACDLDASAFMLDQNNRIIGDDWFVFYGQLNSPDGSIKHSGDSKGEGDGDDEIIDINLSMVNPNVQKIAFVVTIDEALTRGLNFSMVANAYVRIIDAITNQEIARFNLTDYYSNVTAMVVGELYRYNGIWKFNSVGDGVAKDLAGLCEMYGVQVAD